MHSLKKFSILNQMYLSVFTASVILVLSVCSPLSSKAAEADAGTGSTQSSTQTAAEEPFHYEHDPMENPVAAKDIVVNPDAVYGYSPNPDSTRLGKFADAIDWTNKEQVAASREERAAYLEEFKTLYRLIEDMLGEGRSVEEIARAVSTKRNEIRLASYDNNPKGLEVVKQSNLETYGQEEGPTPDQLFEKYGSWQTVVEKALSSNPGMDACLGFYDENYDAYDIVERLDALSDAENDADKNEDKNGDKDEDTASQADASGAAKTYTVKKGDCLWNIAASELGDGSRWPEIYELNKDKINNPRLIYAGQELVLPAA